MAKSDLHNYGRVSQPGTICIHRFMYTFAITIFIAKSLKGKGMHNFLGELNIYFYVPIYAITQKIFLVQNGFVNVCCQIILRVENELASTSSLEFFLQNNEFECQRLQNRQHSQHFYENCIHCGFS
jgi:hypothetical protein